MTLKQLNTEDLRPGQFVRFSGRREELGRVAPNLSHHSTIDQHDQPEPSAFQPSGCFDQSMSAAYRPATHYWREIIQG